jgi:hypothetical protein
VADELLGDVVISLLLFCDSIGSEKVIRIRVEAETRNRNQERVGPFFRVLITEETPSTSPLAPPAPNLGKKKRKHH